MTDSDKPNSDNLNSDSANASHSKPNKAGRTSDIYERFLNRVQKIDSEINDDLTKTSSYEPLSEEELLLFADFKEDYDNNNDLSLAAASSAGDGNEEVSADSVSFTYNSEDDDLEVAADVKQADITKNEDEDNGIAATETTNNNLASDDNIDSSELKKEDKSKLLHAVRGKPVSSVKLLIVGVVCGLLLSAAIVFFLNKTGLLSALTDGLATSGSTTDTPQQPGVDSTVETKLTTEPAVAAPATENTATNNEDSDSASPEAVIAPTITKPTALEPESSTAQQPSLAPKNNTDAGITEKDFREEAQNTLYRETNDSL